MADRNLPNVNASPNTYDMHKDINKCTPND